MRSVLLRRLVLVQTGLAGKPSQRTDVEHDVNLVWLHSCQGAQSQRLVRKAHETPNAV
jgi:hypothetical protein